MDQYLQAARQQRLQAQAPKPGVSSGVDPRAWLSEIGAIGGGIAGGALSLGNPFATAAGAAAGSSLGKLLEQKVKNEPVNVRDLATEAAISGVLSGGPIKLGKGLLGIARGGAKEATKQGVKTGIKAQAIEKVSKKAAASYLQVSPSAAKQVTKSGFTVKQLAQRATQFGLTPDDMIGKLGNTGPLNKTISSIEKTIQKAATKDLTKKISGETIINALKEEQKALGLQIANRTKQRALDAIIKETEKKYAKGLTVKQGLDILRSANNTFGKTIIDVSSKDAVNKAAQKIEGNAMRALLKGTVPQLKTGLDEQHLLLTLKDLVIDAQAKINAGQLKVPEIGINPTTWINAILKSPTAQRKILQESVKIETGKQVAKKGVEQAPSLLRQAGSQATRQALATGARGLLSPIPAVPEEVSITETISGLGAEPTPTPIDPRLPRVAAAIEQDIARTGGKNLKNIQIIAGLYGIDLTPIGLGTTTKKSTVDAATKRQLAGIRTGAGIVDELENLIQQTGGGAGRVGGSLLGIAGRVGLAPEARTFTAARNAYISRLSRALGEVGVLTDQDIARAREAVPNINDSPREVQLKLASLRRIINDAYNELQAQFQ